MYTEFKGLTYAFSLWTFILRLVFVTWTTAEGQPRIIGSSQPIVAAPGDDVILPCHLEPPLDLQGYTLEWSKPDQSQVQYVYLYRDKREIPDMQFPSYAKRTRLFTDALKSGNISLKLSNVTLADQGRYTCLIPKLRSPVKQSVIRLVVDPNFVRTQTTETPLDPRTLPPTPGPGNTTNSKGGRTSYVVLIVSVVLSVLVLAAGAGYYFIRRHQKLKDVDYEAAPSEQPSVSVPC